MKKTAIPFWNGPKIIIKEKEPMAEEYMVEDADIVMVAFGATARIVKSAVNSARAKGIKAGT